MDIETELFIGGTILIFFFGLINWLMEYNGETKSGCAGKLFWLWITCWFAYIIYHFISKYW